jgi:hypothetical protein
MDKWFPLESWNYIENMEVGGILKLSIFFTSKILLKNIIQNKKFKNEMFYKKFNC